jgi:aerobic carbon-monoxide dehydrogenase medium subunit
MSFAIASTVDDALAALAGGARPIAGGSDLVVAARHGKAPLPTSLVAIDRLTELAAVETLSDGGVRIGALATHAQLMTHPRIVESFTALADAGALVGSPATRNVGTLGGNVMNGSPAMDTGAPLVVFDAVVELRSVGDSRDVPIADIWLGPGRTAARTDELCVAIRLSARRASTGSAYVRLEYRRAMEIAVVGAAASIELEADGSIASLGVALSAVAPTIVAVDVSSVIGRQVDESTLAAVAAAAVARSAPISDVRASDEYRRHCVGVMARRAVDAAARRAHGESITVPVNRALGIGASR